MMASVWLWCDRHGSVQSAINMKHYYIYMSTTHRASLSCSMHNCSIHIIIRRFHSSPTSLPTPVGTFDRPYFSLRIYIEYFSLRNSFRITVQIIAIDISIVSIKHKIFWFEGL